MLFCCDQAYVHRSVMEELKRIIDDSEITKEDDALWPPPDRVGRQVCLGCSWAVVGVFGGHAFFSFCWVCAGSILSRFAARYVQIQPCLVISAVYSEKVKPPTPPPPIPLQELEIVIGDEHISFTTSKIGSLIDVNQSK